MHLALLRQILSMVTSSLTGKADTFPPLELRFVLEYVSPPSFDAATQKISILLGSHAFRLDRLSPSPSHDRFAVLRFPAVERTLGHHTLFDIGYELCVELDLISAEPDLGSAFFVDPDPLNGKQLESALPAALCEVSYAPPIELRWSLDKINADKAWIRSQGAGILIGHPDTGFAEHDTLSNGTLNLSLGKDLIDGHTVPKDPLHASMANPGHGTATASVIAGHIGGGISGVAPAATLVPIRCIEDVKVFNQAPVAAAIAHAHSTGCQVISMSLGGVPSRALHAAVKAAVDDGVIVLAAAGNCVRTVVWPARYDEVIAVGGTNILDMPWKGSCRGPAVDISAPAEHVWCAKRSKPDESVSAIKPGQGTSYAVATVAGIAALWLSRHTVQAVRAEANLRRVSISLLFKVALQHTARRPNTWEEGQLGAGVADAAALLELELANIPTIFQRESVSDSTRSVRQLLSDEICPLSVLHEFDWKRYGCELATIALSQVKIGGELVSLTREAKSRGTNPSRGLNAAVNLTGNETLRKFGGTEKTSVSRPLAYLTYPVTDNLFRHALALQNTGLESTAGKFNLNRTQDYLLGSGIQEQLARLDRVLTSLSVPTNLHGEVLSAAEQALDTAKAGKKFIESIGRFGLEALVALTGRPALRVHNGDLNLNDPQADQWHDRLFIPARRGDIKRVTAAVGRIDVNGRHVGTGFMAAPDLVLTNRHVLQELAAAVPTRNRPSKWLLEDTNPTIDFADNPSSMTTQSKFKITQIIAWGERYIDDDILDFSLVDAALLRIESTNANGQSSPAPLTFSGDLGKVDQYKPILTVGYPAMPVQLPRGVDGKIDLEVAMRLNELFSEYNVKYLSPGEVMRAPGGSLSMRHDATTLSGCSGSCVLALDHGLNVVGLHFGGSWLRENFAHALENLRRGDKVINDAGITWT